MKGIVCTFFLIPSPPPSPLLSPPQFSSRCEVLKHCIQADCGGAPCCYNQADWVFLIHEGRRPLARYIVSGKGREGKGWDRSSSAPAPLSRLYPPSLPHSLTLAMARRYLVTACWMRICTVMAPSPQGTTTLVLAKHTVTFIPPRSPLLPRTTCWLFLFQIMFQEKKKKKSARS